MRFLQVLVGLVALTAWCCESRGQAEDVARQEKEKHVVFLNLAAVAPEYSSLVEKHCKQAFGRIEDLELVGPEATEKRNGFEFVFMMNVRPIERDGVVTGYALSATGYRKVSLDWAVRIFGAKLKSQGRIPSFARYWLAVEPAYLNLSVCDSPEALGKHITNMVERFNATIIEQKRTREIESALEESGN